MRDDTEQIGDSIEAYSEYVVVMDSFGGEWTPVAALTDATAAIELREMLDADAAAVCATAPYYATKQDVRDGVESAAPAGLDQLAVAFDGKEVVAISDNDWAARESQCKHDALRTEVDVYGSAEAVADEIPAVAGAFIDSQLSAEDLVGETR